MKYSHTRFINVLNFIMVMFIHVSLHASRCAPRVRTNEIINEHTQRRLPYEIDRDVHKIIERCITADFGSHAQAPVIICHLKIWRIF